MEALLSVTENYISLIWESLISFAKANIPFLVFIVVLTGLLVYKRKKLEFQGNFPVLYILMFKTQLGVKYMKEFHKKHPRVTSIFSKFSLFIGLSGCLLVFIMMIWQLWYIVVNDISSGGGLVLPVKTDSSAVFYVPLFYWVASIFVLAVVHEAAHGIVAEKFKTKIKSSGFAILGVLLPILPAAFVEPDEKKMAKLKPRKQYSILGAGAASNIIFGIIFLLLFIPVAKVASGITTAENLQFQEIMEESALNKYNLSAEKYTITAFNGETNTMKALEKIHNISLGNKYNISLSYMKEGDTVNETYQFTPINKSGNAMVGITRLSYETKVKEKYYPWGHGLLSLKKLLFYLWLLNIGIGLINLLPLWITDGGQIFRIFFTDKLGEKKGTRLYHLVSYVSLLLIIFTIFPSLLGF